MAAAYSILSLIADIAFTHCLRRRRGLQVAAVEITER
jgi:hypothetical protein